MPSHNALPLGSKWIDGQGYVRIKTAHGLRRWPTEHRVVWEAANGPIPTGATLHHINENKTDNRLENLRLCASEAEHQRLYHSDRLLERNKRGMSPESIAKMAATKRGRRLTAEHRAKIAAGNIGRIVTAETRAKIGAKHAGKTLSEETRRKISASRTGIGHTAEARAKIGAAARGRPKSPETIERMKAAQRKRFGHPLP